MKPYDHLRSEQLPLIVLLFANGLSLVGNMLTSVAVPWFVLETTGSAAKTGVTGAVIVAPTIIAGIFGGALVDRLGFRRMSVVSDIGSGITVALIPLLHVTIGITFMQLLILMFLSALLDVPGTTARQSMLPELAHSAGMRLERANSVFSSITRGAQLAGPILAGVLIAKVGANSVLWLDAATFAVSALAVALAIPEVVNKSEVRSHETAGYLRDILQGVGLLANDKVLRILIIAAALLNFVANPMASVVLPVYAQELYGSAANLGLMLAGFGGGALAGAVLYGIGAHLLPRRVVFIAGVAAAAIPLAVLAAYPGVPITIAALALFGIGTGPLAPIFMTVAQERTPPEMRGRMFGLMAASVWIVLPIGMLTAGVLIEGFGLRMTLLLQSGLFLILAVILLFIQSLYMMETPPDGTHKSI